MNTGNNTFNNGGKPSFDKETFIGITLCLILMLAWPGISEALGWSTPAPEAETVTETAAPAVNTPAPAPAADNTVKKIGEKTASAEKKDLPSSILFQYSSSSILALPADPKLSNDAVELNISAVSGSVSKIAFLKHKQNDLTSPLSLDSQLFELNIPGSSSKVKSVSKDDSSVRVIREIAAGNSILELEQIFTVKDDYIINCQYIFRNNSQAGANLTGMTVKGGTIPPWHTITGDKMRTMSFRMDFIDSDGSHKDIDGDEDDEDYYFVKNPTVKWASVSNKYFISIIKSGTYEDFTLWQQKPRPTVKDSKGKEFNKLTIGASVPDIKLLPGESATFEFSSYTGPKSVDALSKFVPGGEKALHLAWGPLNYLARFLMWILNLLYAIFHSYGISIIILTLLVRTAFYPLTSKGNESMRKMQKVQPLFKELKEKYKDNPQLLNQKMAELYRAEGINPLAGCLLILLQIPIFFALYAMLDNAIALRHVSFLWAKNLAAADTIFSIPLGFTLPLLDINAIPVNPLVLMMTALMVIQQRMTPMSMDPAQKKMMNLMPVIMLLFLYDLPSGLTLYWTVSNLFSIIQLWLQKKRNQALNPAANGQSK